MPAEKTSRDGTCGKEISAAPSHGGYYMQNCEASALSLLCLFVNQQAAVEY